MTGRILFVLHAHLPFVRHPEHPRFFEEDWLFEAIEGCYLPLLEVFAGWQRDGIPARVTVSVSPTLLAMWQDRLLQERFRAHLDRRSALRAEELRRLGPDPRFGPLAEAEAERGAKLRAQYEALGGDLAAAFSMCARAGTVELATTAATHPLLPVFQSEPGFVAAQIGAAVRAHAEGFGMAPRTFWSPECGWYSGLDRLLLAEGLRATFVEGRALSGAAFGVDRPVRSPAGVLVFGRDPEVARQVWSRDVGLPGDPRYLDFFRDAAFERSEAAVAPYVLPDGARVPLGLRYHAVTDRRRKDKRPYDPSAAAAAIEEHAARFVAERAAVHDHRARSIRLAPITTAPFDAELFGHWWREGPRFVDRIARLGARRLAWVTPSDLLDLDEPAQVFDPAPGTWGESGDLSTWVGPETAPVFAELLSLCRRLHRRPAFRDPALHARAVRELWLAAASDWPFLIHLGTAKAYAERRMHTHLAAAAALADALEDG